MLSALGLVEEARPLIDSLTGPRGDGVGEGSMRAKHGVSQARAVQPRTCISVRAGREAALVTWWAAAQTPDRHRNVRRSCTAHLRHWSSCATGETAGDTEAASSQLERIQD